MISRFAVVALAISAFANLATAAEGDKPALPAAKTFTGKVLPLADIVKERGEKVDEDAAKASRVIACEDGKTYSLVKDEASRLFFKDDRMLSRTVQVTAVEIPGTQLLVIKKVQTLVDGKLQDVDYWCAKCELTYTEPGECVCCGQQTVLRERPADRVEE
jgi:hypothetical protein